MRDTAQSRDQVAPAARCATRSAGRVGSRAHGTRRGALRGCVGAGSRRPATSSGTARTRRRSRVRARRARGVARAQPGHRVDRVGHREHAETSSSPVGSWSRGTSRPHSSSCGSTTTGMNCTAWNSVRANALTHRPERRCRERRRAPRPRRRPTSARDVQAARRPTAAVLTTEWPEPRQRARTRGVPRRRSRPCRSGIVMQPVERAGGALAQRGHRGHQEHRQQRKDAEQRPTDAIEDVVLVAEEPRHQRDEHDRHDEDQGQRAVVTAQLRATRAAVAAMMRGFMPPPPEDVPAGTGRRPRPSGRRCARAGRRACRRR